MIIGIPNLKTKSGTGSKICRAESEKATIKMQTDDLRAVQDQLTNEKVISDKCPLPIQNSSFRCKIKALGKRRLCYYVSYLWYSGQNFFEHYKFFEGNCVQCKSTYTRISPSPMLKDIS